MFKRWLKNYQALMLKTRFFSQVAAFLLLVLAIVDLVGVGRGITYAENIGWEAVWRGTIPAVAFILGFGTRFGVLLSKDRFGILAVAASWWVVFFAVMMTEIISPRSCWIDCQVDPNISVSYLYYDPLTDPLVPAGLLFIFLSFFRFVITAAGAFLYRK